MSHNYTGQSAHASLRSHCRCNRQDEDTSSFQDGDEGYCPCKEELFFGPMDDLLNRYNSADELNLIKLETQLFNNFTALPLRPLPPIYRSALDDFTLPKLDSKKLLEAESSYKSNQATHVGGQSSSRNMNISFRRGSQRPILDPIASTRPLACPVNSPPTKAISNLTLSRPAVLSPQKSNDSLKPPKFETLEKAMEYLSLNDPKTQKPKETPPDVNVQQLTKASVELVEAIPELNDSTTDDEAGSPSSDRTVVASDYKGKLRAETPVVSRSNYPSDHHEEKPDKSKRASHLRHHRGNESRPGYLNIWTSIM